MDTLREVINGNHQVGFAQLELLCMHGYAATDYNVPAVTNAVLHKMLLRTQNMEALVNNKEEMDAWLTEHWSYVQHVTSTKLTTLPPLNSATWLELLSAGTERHLGVRLDDDGWVYT
jgi:hypothetical protein